MVQEENNILRAGTVTVHFKVINFQTFSIILITYVHTHTHNITTDN